MTLGRRRWRVEGVMALLVVVGVTAPAVAHHSFAMFDHTRTLALKGTVTKFQWTNPHAYLDIDVSGKDGVKHYTLEMTSINMMQRVGWRSNLIKAGDEVKAVMAPLLNGEPAGLLLEIVLADGRRMELPVPAIGSFKRTPETE